VSIVSLVRDPGGNAFGAAVEREAEERREALRVEWLGAKEFGAAAANATLATAGPCQMTTAVVCRVRNGRV
jgi:hypothetical protein